MAAMGPGNRLPPDWNYSVTRDGRIFFINEVQRQTTWLHPLTGHTVQTGYERVKGLPMGWEHGYTPDGDLYFINHNDHKTTFEHPVTGSVSNKKLTFRDYGYPAPEAAVDDKSLKPNSKSRSIKLQVPAAKRSPDAQVTRKGWLHRYESTGIGKKTWRKRWCVLAEYALFFYKDEKEKHSLGSILLPSYRINNCDSSDVVNKAFAFKIEHENTKTCYLAADSIDELNIWVRSVQEAAMLKGSPTFHREPNNNFTNFSKLNNMKLIPKSPIIVQHDDSDDEVPFFTKLSEWEKSWKSPGSYRKADEDLSPPQLRRERQPNGNHGPYPDDGYGEYTQIHPETRNNNGSNPNFDPRSGPNDPKSLPRDDPRQRFSGSDGSSPRGGGLQRWHNEPPQNLGSNRSIDPRYQSVASNRSDARQQRAPDQYGHNESQNHNNGRGSSRGDPRNSGTLSQNIQMSREQQRMSYDGAYSPKRAENQREAANRKDYPGRFIDTAYHPSLQNIPGPTQKPSDDRIFPEFKDRTQSQPNLTHPVDEHHRFGPPNDNTRNQQVPIPKNRNMHASHEPREPTRGPIAAPRTSRNPDMDNQRGSMSCDRARDIYSGNVGPHQQAGTQDPRNSYSGSNRGSLVGANPNQGDIYSGNFGPNHQTRSQDPRNSYSGSNRGSLAGAQPNQRDSFPGRAGPQGDSSRERGSLAGQRNSFHGNGGVGAPRDSYSGSTGQRNSFHGGQHPNYSGGPVQEDNFRPDRNRESYASNRQRDSYPGSRNSLNYPEQKGRTQEEEMRRPQEQEMRRPPVAAPRRTLSPERNPGLTIDIPPNYINLSPGTHPGNQQPGSLDNGPTRPPYPAAFRQEMVEELAKDKTPRTSQQYLTSAENERKRMQQSPYFQYPNNQNQPQQNPGSRNSLPRDGTTANDNQKDGRWEDNSAQELRAAYERVQQLQHSQPPSDPNTKISSGTLVQSYNNTMSSVNISAQQVSHISLSNPSSTLLDPSLSPQPLQGTDLLYENDSPKYAVPSLEPPPPITRLLNINDYENRYAMNIPYSKQNSTNYTLDKLQKAPKFHGYYENSEPSPVYEIPDTSSQISPHYLAQSRSYAANLGSSTDIFERGSAFNSFREKNKPASKNEYLTSTLNAEKIRQGRLHPFFEPRYGEHSEKIPRTSTKIELTLPKQSSKEKNILKEIADFMKHAESGHNNHDTINYRGELTTKQSDSTIYHLASTAVMPRNDERWQISEYFDQSKHRTDYLQTLEDIYSTVNKKKAPPRKTFPMHTVKEDPNMSDRDIFTTTEIKNLNKKYPLNGSRIRMSISANDLIGKNHDELVLLLIQLRRNQSALGKARDYYKQHLESRRPNEKEYRKQRQNSPGAMDRVLEEEHMNYTDLKHQMDEIENKLEVYKPIINLVDNMVTMGSLYGGDNLMLATQYRRHLLQPDQYTEPKDMIQFSRQRQENKMVEEIENEIKQLTDEEVDLEDKLERLYELDRRLQEQSFLVTSFSEDKEMLEKALQGILKQQDQKRDDPREMRALMQQQRTIEKELSRVTQQLAEASRLLEETTAENNKIDHEVALLRTKVHGDLQRSRSAPSLVDDHERNKRKMEKELAKVQTMMSGLSKEGERLQEAMSTIRRSSSGANLAALLDKDEDKALKKAKTYMQTDIDSMETIDLSRQPKGAASMPNINMIEPESANQSYSSNYATMSSPMRTSATDQSDYVEMHSRSSSLIEDTDRARSKSLNELNKDVPPPPPRNFNNKPLISHQRQESSVAPPSEMYNSLGDGDDAWDIGHADDNTKRFYGLIPRERPKLLTVRDVKRQSEQRRERDKTRRGPDDLTDDESRWSLAEGNEPIDISHVRYPSDSTGSMLSGYHPDSVNGMSQPLYENLPRAKSVPNISGDRSSGIELFTPKPFTPYQSKTSSSQSSDSPKPMQEVEIPSFMQKKVSTLSSSKPFYSEMDIPTYKKENGLFYNDNMTGSQTEIPTSKALPWLKSGSQLMGNVLNVSKSPRGRYVTISSSEPAKREIVPFASDTLHSASAGDIMTNKSIDDVPDVVKSSTSQVSKIDEYSIDDILRGPQKVLIPERYMPDSDEEYVSDDELIRRKEKSEKIKKILTQQSIHSLSQPDISGLHQSAHETARQEKAKRNELLGVGQELARQVTLKSKKAAAARRQTWSGRQFSEVMSQIETSTTEDRSINEHKQSSQQYRENIFV